MTAGYTGNAFLLPARVHELSSAERAAPSSRSLSAFSCRSGSRRGA
uniref:Uncharacterized protein n=1 Tax=Anguilla anguilla TaxID=7936 RepID=A0A0E9TNS8_ANGAN